MILGTCKSNITHKYHKQLISDCLTHFRLVFPFYNPQKWNIGLKKGQNNNWTSKYAQIKTFAWYIRDHKKKKKGVCPIWIKEFGMFFKY